tara:strand:- start:300 stop:446 length:147 start_codon:yes stop_codon:yes gene_type:complete
MIILNIAEWIANLFILGIAALIWAIVIFMLCMFVSMGADKIKEYIHGK